MCILGFGSSNDGNTSRRFFSDIDETSRITKVNSDVLRRFATILAALNTTKTLINPDKFENFCRETAQLYVAKYKS